jgi:hypothetical protein
MLKFVKDKLLVNPGFFFSLNLVILEKFRFFPKKKKNLEFTLENKKFQIFYFPISFSEKRQTLSVISECFCFFGKFGKVLEKNCFCSGVNSTIFPISSEKPSKILVSENWKKIIAGGW